MLNKEEFYNSLAGEKFVINSRNMDGLKVRTMKDYQGLHLKCDVLLLADVFEKFRNKSLKYYGVCASHYFTAPALS